MIFGLVPLIVGSLLMQTGTKQGEKWLGICLIGLGFLMLLVN